MSTFSSMTFHLLFLASLDSVQAYLSLPGRNQALKWPFHRQRNTSNARHVNIGLETLAIWTGTFAVCMRRNDRFNATCATKLLAIMVRILAFNHQRAHLQIYFPENLSQHRRSLHLKCRTKHCTRCGYSKDRGSDLNKHIRIVHEKQRAFPCDFCDTSFTQDGKDHRFPPPAKSLTNSNFRSLALTSPQ